MEYPDNMLSAEGCRKSFGVIVQWYLEQGTGMYSFAKEKDGETVMEPSSTGKVRMNEAKREGGKGIELRVLRKRSVAKCRA